MPRKSAAAIAMLDPRARRLDPPPDLSEAEQTAFLAIVRSVNPRHFAAEDTALLTAYAAAIVQERAIARELEGEQDEKAKDRLRTAHGRVAGTLARLARSLRLGALPRAPSRNRRLPGTIEPSGPLPWEYASSQRGEVEPN